LEGITLVVDCLHFDEELREERHEQKRYTVAGIMFGNPKRRQEGRLIDAFRVMQRIWGPRGRLELFVGGGVACNDPDDSGVTRQLFLARWFHPNIQLRPATRGYRTAFRVDRNYSGRFPSIQQGKSLVISMGGRTRTFLLPINKPGRRLDDRPNWLRVVEKNR